MQPFPHIYTVAADGSTTGSLVLTAEGVSELAAVAPREFDGPGDEWSPEGLLVAAVASCFILSFRAVARGSRLEWTRLECAVEGTLDRVDNVTQFTKFVVRARLTIPSTTASDTAQRVLQKAEQTCLISNSLRGTRELAMEIVPGL